MSNFRKSLFWLSDFLRGASVRKNLHEIEFILANEHEPSAEKLKSNYLRSLLDHAVESTPFYHTVAKGSDLQKFPIIDKNIIRENFEAFRSRKYSGQKLHRVSTSGSTGVPFFVWQNKEKRDRQAAENLYFNQQCGFNVGERLYYFRIWNEINRLSEFQKFTKNIVPVEVSQLGEHVVSDFVNDVQQDQSRKAFLAYSSTYEGLLRLMNSMGIKKVKANVSCIFAIAELLPNETREQLQEVFECPVVCRYSNSENGFIGHQFPHGPNGYYRVNTASFTVEILNLHNNERVEQGETGRIVVTDLFNHAMPMIRYDTGDIGSLVVDSNNGRSFFDRVEGRRLDFIFSTSGTLLSPHVIDYAIRRCKGVRQFQCIQKKPGVYKILILREDNSTVSEEEISSNLRTYLGSNAIVEFEYVTGIPLLASGKRKIVVNEMNNV
jgi:phenylacetate-CoA ligase